MKALGGAKTVLTAVAAFIAYLVLVVMGAKRLGVPADRVWLLVAVLALLGLCGVGLYFWFEYRKRQTGAPAEPAPVAGSEEIDLLLREANAKLAKSSAAGSGVNHWPVFLLTGDEGSAKTSVLLASGLEPELLAGQVYTDNRVSPTRAANFWFTQRCVFVEAGGKLQADSSQWTKLVNRLRPATLKSVMGAGGQAPRAVVLCISCEVLQAGGDALTGRARHWQARLGEIARTYGVDIPVYVLFTKADRLHFFAEYVRQFSNDEAGQVLGVTLPKRAGNAGVYAEEEAARLSNAFAGLFNGLCGGRLRFLPREGDAKHIPAAYEFPREFRKLRASLVQFLVDLARPSQLSTGPFLRGFYFSGVRPVVVTAQAAQLAAVTKSQTSDPNATGVFRAGVGVPVAAATAAPSSKRVPQWLFLPRLFHEILLPDPIAQVASAASRKTSLGRRVLLGAAAALGLLLITAWTVSYFGNRALEQEALKAATALRGVEGEGKLPSLDSLQKLDTLRQSLVRLTGYERDGAPLHLRWGLYMGSELYPEVRKTYYDRFARLLFRGTQDGLQATLKSLPATPGPNDNYGVSYDALRAYLITTSNHEYSTVKFLSPLLLSRWSTAVSPDADRRKLAAKQFDFYSEDLQRVNPYSPTNEADAVQHARTYLNGFQGPERVYQVMLKAANQKEPTVVYNERFPGSDRVVINRRPMQGAFSKNGWAFMQEAFKTSDRYLNGEAWVLGRTGGTTVDAGKLQAFLQDRYTKEFIAQWRDYLHQSQVVRYSGLGDAAAKLNLQSGNQSPLLALFWLASQNTGVDSAAVKEAFQPVHAVVPPTSNDRYITPASTDYITGLVTLQAAIEKAASLKPPDPLTIDMTLGTAASARLTAKKMEQGFRLDQEAHLETVAGKLLEDPITHAEGWLKSAGPAELNAKGKALCGEWSDITRKFPFNPSSQAEVSLAELNKFLKPKEGALWAFREQNLKTALTQQGATWVQNPASGPALNPAFIRFFNEMSRLADALYADGQNPKFTYTLAPQPNDQLQAIALTIDGQTASGPKQFTWPGGAVQGTRLELTVTGGSEFKVPSKIGLWSVWRFIADADNIRRAGNGYLIEWIFRTGTGKDTTIEVKGRPLGYRFNLDIGNAPPLFDKAYLSSLKCVSTVAMAR